MKKIIIVEIIIVLISISIYYYFLWPQQKEFSNVKNEYTLKKDSLHNAEIKISNKDMLLNDIANLEQKIPLTKKQKLPSQAEIPIILDKIKRNAEEAKIEISLEKGDIISQSFYSELPVEMIIRGGYHNLGKFIFSMSQMSCTINITDLNINALNKEISSHAIECGLKANINVSNPEL